MKLEAPNYTQSPNILFDEIFKTLKEGELRIVLVLIRQTFGWHKQWDQISIRMLADKTGMERKSVQRSIKTLIEQGLVEEKRFGINGNVRVYFRLVMEEMQQEKFDDDEITEEEIEMLSNNSYPRPEIQEPASQKINTGVIEMPTKESITKEKKQQQAAQPVAAFSQSKKQEKQQPPKIHDFLKDIDIPQVEKIQISTRYDEAIAKNACMWATHPDTKINKTLAAAIKWACEFKPEIPKNKQEEELLNKNFALKYEGKKSGEIFISTCSKYIEVVFGACQKEPLVLYYNAKDFMEQFKNILNKYGFQLLTNT